MELPAGFEQRWHAARRRNDTEALGELALETEQNAPAPDWLQADAWEVISEIANYIGANLDRQDDSRIGVNLIHIGALIDPGDAVPFTLAGLAYECWQPRIKNNPLNQQIPDLLESQLEFAELLAEARFESFMPVVRELCVLRVVDLIRADFARRFEPLNKGYHDAIGRLRRETSHKLAEADLRTVGETAKLLTKEHRRLAWYIPALMNSDNRAHVRKSLDLLESLIVRGREAADKDRWKVGDR